MSAGAWPPVRTHSRIQERTSADEGMPASSARCCSAAPGRSPAPAPAPDMLVWPRDEVARAAERWPEVFAADVAAHCSDVERRLRRLADKQHRKTIMLLVGSVEAFEQHLRETGGDAADEPARQSYATHLRELGRTTSWPPERNQLCWCGSARKYKKCCGGPGSV